MAKTRRPKTDRPKTPHDKLVKLAFEQPEHAAGELRALVPPELAARIRWDTLKLEPGSLVDEDLRELHTDLLFSARLDDGEEDRQVLTYLLFEHQSTPNRFMAARLLIYASRILARWLRQHPNADRIPAILPMVLYHGTKKWDAPLQLLELVDLPGDLLQACAPYLPSLAYLLDDLTQTSDEELRQRDMTAHAQLVTLSLKHARVSTELEKLVAEWVDLMRAMYATPDGRQALIAIMRYCLTVNDRVTGERLLNHLTRVLGDDADEMKEVMMTAGEQLIEQGRQQGIQQGIQRGIEKGLQQGIQQGREQGIQQGREQGIEKGRQRGHTQGLRDMVQRQLGIKFGHLPASTVDRVNAALPAELDTWAERLLNASALKEVFGDHD